VISVPLEMRRVASLCAYYFVSFAFTGAYLPYFPRWLEARGMAGTQFGIISACGPAMGMIAPIAIGVVADTMGLRGGLLQVALAGALVALVTLASLAFFHVPLGFFALFGLTLVLALFRSPTTLMADVLALEYTAAGRTSYGRQRLWGTLGFTAAAVAIPYIMDPGDAFRFPLVLTGLTLASLLAALVLPGRVTLPARASRGDWRSLWATNNVRWFFLAAFLSQCAHVAYDLCFTIHLLALGMSRTTIGLTWAVGTGAEVILLAVGSRMFRVMSPASVLAWGLAGSCARWILIATVRSPTVLFCLQPLHAVSFAVVWLALIRFTSRRFPPRLLGTAQGTLSTCMGAGSVLGMIVWGAVFHRLGGAAVFAGAASFAACASLCALLVRRSEGVTPGLRESENADGSPAVDPNTSCGRQTT
jgi:PPP family 3-phenylpropionic acid transporter